VSQCPACGTRALQCGDHRDAGQSIWTGEWPGEVECRQLGWYARWTVTSAYSRDGLPDTGRQVACSPDEPGANPDLQRLTIAGATGELVWDRQQERWTTPTRPALEAGQ
jgi:hypothetical protein